MNPLRVFDWHTHLYPDALAPKVVPYLAARFGNAAAFDGTVAGAKRSLNYSRGRTVEEGLRDVALWNAGTLVSADLGAAVQARLAKQIWIPRPRGFQ